MIITSKLLSDELHRQREASILAHQARIEELRSRPTYEFVDREFLSFDRHSPLWDRITLFLEKDSARDGRPENRYSREQFETVYIERCHSKGISAYRIDVSFKRGSSYAGAQWYTNEKELFEAFG